MRDTVWAGKSTSVNIRSGSSKPPQWALNAIDRVCGREGRSWMELRWTNDRSGRGARGRTYNRSLISVTAGGRHDRDYHVVLHELAHAVNRNGDRHGDGFYDALARIARDEGATRLVYREHKKSHAMAPLQRAVKRLG